MKHLLLTAIAASICVCTYAADEWKTYFKNSKAEISYRYSDCHDNANGIHQQKILLKFVNLQNTKTEISFDKEIKYQGSKAGVADAKAYSIQLQPLETREGVCSDKNKLFVTFSKQLNFDSRELEKFELKNISVKTIQ